MNFARYSSVAAVIVTALSYGNNAAAQTAAQRVPGFAVDRFDPAERGSDWFSSESLDFRGHGRFAAGAVGDYNHDALVTRSATSSLNHDIVSDQLVLNLGGNVVLWDRLRLGLNLPIAAYATGQDAATSSQSLSAPSSSAIGDARISSDVRIFGQYGDAITGAVGLAVHAPTGKESAYMSDGNIRVTPRAMLAGKISFFEWSARGGFAVRPEQTVIQGAQVGSEVTFGGAAGVRFLDGRILIGPEMFGGVGTETHAKTTSLEAMMGVHGKITDSIRLAAGAGAGMTTGFGTPAWRTTIGFEWAPGYQDHKPLPQAQPEKQPEPPPAPVAAAAAPPPLPQKPVDRDNDSVADVDDQCPDDPGPVERKGCPLAMVQNNRIVIMEQVKFRTGSAELDPAGDPVLNAVAEVLNKHSEIEKIRVEGHTDTKGLAKMNVQLSKARAAAVAKWLATHSVEENRLQSAGFGAAQPIATNATEEGRRENRRVEFHIVEGGHASR